MFLSQTLYSDEIPACYAGLAFFGRNIQIALIFIISLIQRGNSNLDGLLFLLNLVLCMEFILVLIADKRGLQRHADLSDMENLAVLLGSLCSNKQLPTDIGGIDQELFAKFYDQWKGTFDYTEKSAGAMDKEAEEVIDKKDIIENTDFKLLLTPVKEDLALQLRKQMEKSYLSLFQITSNARKFAGMT